MSQLTFKVKLPALYGEALKQIPFAVSLALNKTAKAMQAAETGQIKQVFDRPTPYTQRSVMIRFSDKKTQQSAFVFERDESTLGTAPEKFLQAEVFGGPRRDKRSEKLLRQAGLLPDWAQTVVSRYAPTEYLDQYGNMRGAKMQMILSGLQAQGDAYANETKRSRRKAKRTFSFFVGRPGGVTGFSERNRKGSGQGKADSGAPLGIYLRDGQQVHPILLFMKKGTYKPRFHFFETGETVGQAQFDDFFTQAFNYAMRSAK